MPVFLYITSMCALIDRTPN